MALAGRRACPSPPPSHTHTGHRATYRVRSDRECDSESWPMWRHGRGWANKCAERSERAVTSIRGVQQ
eukprot:scaffold9695_cov126-Isochrysis_galbana.AAC.2